MKNTQRSKNSVLIKKSEIIIILIILAVAAAAFFFFSKSGENAVITIDKGDNIKKSLTKELSGKKESEIFELEGAVIEINNGRIRIKSSDCPNQICVNTGYISEKGEKIVCLPKKLVIEIE